jgi:hypothetical protein
MMRLLPILIIAFGSMVQAPAWAQQYGGGLSDAQVRQQIVRESRADYYATGHPCACPDDLARNGSSCGLRSAYSHRGGGSPACYISDVSDAAVAQWRANHR